MTLIATSPLLQIFVKWLAKHHLRRYSGYRLTCLQAERWAMMSCCSFCDGKFNSFRGIYTYDKLKKIVVMETYYFFVIMKTEWKYLRAQCSLFPESVLNVSCKILFFRDSNGKPHWLFYIWGYLAMKIPFVFKHHKTTVPYL